MTEMIRDFASQGFRFKRLNCPLNLEKVKYMSDNDQLNHDDLVNELAVACISLSPGSNLP